MNSSYTPPIQIQSRLLKLVAVFLLTYSLAVTLSPAARTRSWEVELNWSHWIGMLIWITAGFLAHKQIIKYAIDTDPYLLPASFMLVGWGLLTIWRLDAGFGLRQAVWLAFCTGILILGLKFPQYLDKLSHYKYILLGSGLLLTALTLIFGTNPGGNGPRLWLGCCGLYLQPSEPLKLLLVTYLSAFFADRIPIRTRLFPLLLPSLLLTGLALVILLIQRDLGTASIFLFLYSSLAYLASGKRRFLFVTVCLLIISTLVGYFFVDIIRYRLAAWIDPWTDPSGRSYQVIQSILAVANGGLFGRGPGMGSPGLVPVAHSDFIFTSISEETGLMGSLALLALLALIAARGFLISIRASNHFRRLLAAGITTYFSAQSILIIGGNLRLLPLTGVTLPFVSYGGSSMLTSFIGLLILVQISNEVGEEPIDLPSPQPYLMMAGLIGVGLLTCALVNGWWAAFRAEDLLARTDNPRRTIADRFVLRGALLDRQNRPINITIGDPGSYNRRYLFPELSPVIGYTHPIFGQAGFEASLDPYLRGLKGNPTILIWWDQLLYGQPPAGLNFRLSIDLDIQQRADELLGDHAGALLLANAQTGEILVMASHPTYNANLLDTIGQALPNHPGSPLLNRSTQALYPIDDTLFPLLNAAFGLDKPDDSDLNNLYTKLGFYRTPDLDLPAASAMENGTLVNLTASPAQLLSAVASISNQGICPNLQIASAVETPEQGWVVLPQSEKPGQCLPAIGAKQTALMLQINGKPFWEYVASSSNPPGQITWYLAGTLPNWSGTPLAVVLVLEEISPTLAKTMGQDILQKAIEP